MTTADRSPETQTVLKVFLFTDLVGSTDLKSRLGDAAGAEAIARHDELFRQCLAHHHGEESTHTGDGFFATFDLPSVAVRCALAFQQGLTDLDFPERLKVRIGIHMGEIVQLVEGGTDREHDKLVGLAVDIGSRVMELADGGQLLLTRGAFDSARQQVLEGPGGSHPKWLAHGPYRFKGIANPLEIYEVGVEGLSQLKTPAGSEKAKRVVGPEDEETLGWRPAAGLRIAGLESWALERKLGEGGFGEVWVANEPVCG